MSPSRTDELTRAVLAGAAASAGAVLLFVVGFLVAEAWPALLRIGPGRFVGDGSWHPTEGSFGLAPMLLASVLVAAGAALLAVPLGVLSGVFTAELAPRWAAGPYRRLVELLAGVPSVVWGFWGLVTLVPWIGAWRPPGASLLAGILILTLMVLPTVALVADASLRAVPDDQRRAAAALGLGRAARAWSVIVPSARGGIAAGAFLALARAAGETMAVLMVCGNVVQVPDSVFDPVRTLTANIALEMAYATGDHRSALYVAGLLLIAAVGGLVGLAESLRGRRDDG